MASDNHSRSAVHLSFSERKKTNKEATLSERFAPPLPAGDLCRALKCRKEERCLLENAFTAVCVSRAEIRKNG